MSESETQFLQGFIFKRPRDGAPDFVKGRMSIKVEEAIEFLTKHKGQDWLNADLLVSKDGQKLYFKVDDWQPNGEEPSEDASNIPF